MVCLGPLILDLYFGITLYSAVLARFIEFVALILRGVCICYEFPLVFCCCFYVVVDNAGYVSLDFAYYVLG